MFVFWFLAGLCSFDREFTGKVLSGLVAISSDSANLLVSGTSDTASETNFTASDMVIMACFATFFWLKRTLFLACFLSSLG